MKSYINPDRSVWQELCRRPSDSNPEVLAKVSSILERVRRQGDAALWDIEAEISGTRSPRCSFRVSREEIDEAAAQVPDTVREAVAKAAANIRKFHEAQLPQEISVETAPGVRCIQRPVPISNVGLYIPGGTAPLFSTVLMLAIPAKIAGCPNVTLCSPAGKDGKINPTVLWAADFCGVDNIFAVGGAQAVAAMAYGTESIPRADKIFGPGNQWVTGAKQLLGGKSVAIDMPAGPSEVMVIADSVTDPAFAAADLLSQAEHGRDSQVVLVSDSPEVSASVCAVLERMAADTSRSALAQSALENSVAVVFDNRDDIVAFACEYAPEHLIVECSEPWDIADRITSAGSVFVGPWTPESAGDYASGTNHTLPTCGWGRSFSGVNIDSYMRKMTIQEISREGLEGLGGTITAMADAEGLQAHADAVRVRLCK